MQEKDARARADWLARHAPAPRETDLAGVNGIYPAYLFRRRRTGEVWTSCCGHHITARAEDPAWRAVLDAPHHREPGSYGVMCHMGAMTRPPEPEPKLVACPICGRLAKVKELGRTGKRDNLAAWRRVVVLRSWEGALWAMAYQTRKTYGGEEDLTALPRMELLRVYRFMPGLAERASRLFSGCAWNGYTALDAPPAKLPLGIAEPFTWCSEEGMCYTVLNLDELGRSDFRYCQAPAYLGAGKEPPHTSELMQYLALCTQWPRQVEMLVKLGLREAVSDLIRHRKWNRRAFQWAEPDPCKAFGLSRPELRAWLAAGARVGERMDLAAWYKQLRRAGVRTSFPELEGLRKKVPWIMGRLVSKMARYHVTPARLTAYIGKEETRKGQKRLGTDTLLTEWADYLDDAALLGYDLTNPVWLTPAGLHRKHLDLIAPAGAIRAGKKAEGYRKRLRNLARRYTFTDGRWLIRPPVTAEEIVAEGKVLHHCVGGYAQRHVNGSTTILFLRDRSRPGKPLVTIEMRGNELVQIHGERNDAGARVLPKTRFAAILEPWLAWLAAGSPRDKAGRPVVETVAARSA